MIKGQLRADGIAIAGFQAAFTQVGWDLKAEAKLIETETGHTRATVMVASWPPEVIAKVKELTEAMEQAMGKVFFTTTTAGQMASKPGLNVPTAPGIGEFLGGEDAPPV